MALTHLPFTCMSSSQCWLGFLSKKGEYIQHRHWSSLSLSQQKLQYKTVQNSSWANILQPPEFIIEYTYAQCLYFFKERGKATCLNLRVDADLKLGAKKKGGGGGVRKKKWKGKFHQKVSSIASSRSRDCCLWDQWTWLALARLNTEPRAPAAKPSLRARVARGVCEGMGQLTPAQRLRNPLGHLLVGCSVPSFHLSFPSLQLLVKDPSLVLA